MGKIICTYIGVLLLTGCTYGDTDLYNQQKGKVTIVLDWGGKAMPDSAAFYFYPLGQKMPQVRKAEGKGFEGTLPTGTYQVMVVNTDYSCLTVQSSQGYDRAIAYADPAVRKSRLGLRAGEPSLIDSPQNLYGIGLSHVTVGKEETAYIAYPQQLVFPIQLDVIVKGSLAIGWIDGELSGVSASVHIPTGFTADFSKETAILFPLVKQPDGRFRSSATTFGLRPHTAVESGKVNNRLRLNISLEDQRMFSSEFDITDLVEEAVSNGMTGLIAATIELELTIDPLKPEGLNLQLVGWNTGTGSAGEEK